MTPEELRKVFEGLYAPNPGSSLRMSSPMLEPVWFDSETGERVAKPFEGLDDMPPVSCKYGQSFLERAGEEYEVVMQDALDRVRAHVREEHPGQAFYLFRCPIVDSTIWFLGVPRA